MEGGGSPPTGISRFAVTTFISIISRFAFMVVMELWDNCYSMWIGISIGDDLGYKCGWSVGFYVLVLGVWLWCLGMMTVDVGSSHQLCVVFERSAQVKPSSRRAVLLCQLFNCT